MNPYTGEIRLFAGSYTPADWLLCDGSLQNISVYDELYAIIGTTYGGDGIVTFGLPDLRGRLVLGVGLGPGLATDYTLGQAGGLGMVSLVGSNLPEHNHALNAATDDAASLSPVNSFFAAVGNGAVAYVDPAATGASTVPMNPAVLSTAGGSLAHSNRMPSVALNYIICPKGIFPEPPS